MAAPAPAPEAQRASEPLLHFPSLRVDCCTTTLKSETGVVERMLVHYEPRGTSIPTPQRPSFPCSPPARHPHLGLLCVVHAPRPVDGDVGQAVVQAAGGAQGGPRVDLGSEREGQEGMVRRFHRGRR